MNNEIKYQGEIENRIYMVRGQYVMLDSHLAEFYGVKPIRLREQVKRNAVRFPADFMFQLTENEVDYMVSQNAIPSRQHLGGYLPYVFTEQGVAAVSAILKTEPAVQVSIQIMRAFVQMRRFLSHNAALLQRLDKIELKQLETDNKFEQVFKALESKTQAPEKGIFFDGQVFDAYTFVADLIRSAKHSVVLIDNYIDDTVLTLLSKRNEKVSATIYTQTISKQLKLDLMKHKAQYPPVDIKLFSKAHDRFLILDEKELYHIGASLKDLGKKWFAFSKINNETLNILSNLKNRKELADGE